MRADYSSFKRLKSEQNYWDIIDYGVATSAANCSHTSNIILRKMARYNNVENDFYSNALIWSYALNAGYQTYLYDAQMKGKGHNFFDDNELNLINHNISKTIDSDSAIIDSLTYLNSLTPSFTYIIKKGSHFPYHAPNGFHIKALDSYTLANKQREKYLDNIAYQSDSFFKKLLKQHYEQNVLFIYTSDHGQNLLDRAGLTHCTAGSEPYHREGEVPLVIFANTPLYELKRYAKENYNNASHFNIMPTILSYMGYDAKSLGYDEANTSLNEIVLAIHGFYYGVPFGYFGKKPDFYKIEQ